MVLTVNNVDLTPYLSFQGLKVTRADVIGPNDGTAMNGAPIRDAVARMETLEVNLMPVPATVAKTIMTALDDTTFNVRYSSPRYGIRTTQMYCESVPASYFVEKHESKEYWNGISFILNSVK